MAFLGLVGSAIKAFMKSSSKPTIIDVSIIVDVPTSIEPVVQSVVTASDTPDERPRNYWSRAIQELVGQGDNERKLRAMVELGASDEAIGLEALKQEPPFAIIKILAAYMKERPLKLGGSSLKALSGTLIAAAFDLMASEAVDTSVATRRHDLETYGPARPDLKRDVPGAR